MAKINLTSAYRTADRWLTSFSSMGTWTQSRSTDVPSGQGFGYSLKMDCTTADASPAAGDYIIYNQRIEGQNLQHLLKGTSDAKKLTLTFWIKSNKTGTYICELYDNDNNRSISKSYTIDSASTWEKKTITFEGDTTGTLDNDNAASLYAQWWFGAGSNSTSGTLQTSWGTLTAANRAVGQVNLADSTSNELYITGCQLEVGSTASGFEFEPFEAIQRKCQRYYETGAFMGIYGAGNNTYGWGYYKATKRAAPTVTMTTPTGTATNQANYYSTNSGDRAARTIGMLNDAGTPANASGLLNAANTFTDEDYRSFFYHGMMSFTPASTNDAMYFGRFYANSEL
jgi:hypothetical protein